MEEGEDDQLGAARFERAAKQAGGQQQANVPSEARALKSRGVQMP